MSAQLIRSAGSGAAASRLERAWPTLVGVIGVPIMAFVLLAGGTYREIADPPGRVATQILAVIALAGWLLLSAFLPRIRVRSRLAIPAMAMLGVLWASALTSSRLRLSLEAALTGTVLVLGFLALLGVTRADESRRRLRILIVGVALFVAVGYLVEVGVGWAHWWSLVGDLVVPPLRPSFAGLTLGSPNLIAAYLVLLGPLATALLWRSVGRRLAIPALLLFLVAILLSGSRGGFLGLVAASGAAGILLLLTGGGTWKVALARASRPLRSPRVAIPLVVALLLLAVTVGPALLLRFGTGGEAVRLSFWKSAVHLFLSSPIFGTGPGTWPQLQLGLVQDASLVLVVPHPHNAYLRLLSELGIAGVAAGLLGLALLAARARIALRSPVRWERLESVAALAGLVGLAAHFLVDDLTNLAGVVLMVGLLIAWVEAAASSEGDQVPPSSLGRRLFALAPAVVAVVLLVALPTIIRIDAAELAADRGDRAADSGDWKLAGERYLQAVEQDGELALYRIELGLALANEGDIEGARAQYEIALATDTLPENAIALATLEAAAGDFTAAMVHAHDATTRAGLDVNVFVNAGRVAEQARELETAATWYARAITITPALARSPNLALAASVKAAAVMDALGEAAKNGDFARAALVSAYAGDTTEAAKYLDRIGPSARSGLLGHVVAWIGGDRATAEPYLRAELQANPLDFDAAGWLANLLAIDGDSAATTYRDWAAALRGDAAPEVVFEYSRIPATGVDRALSRWSGYPDAIYMRHGPVDLLPPQAIVVGVNRPG